MKRISQRYAKELIRLTEDLSPAQAAKVIDRFASILIDRKQAALLPEVMAAVEEAPEAGSIEVRVSTAAPMGKAEADRLRKGLSEKVGAPVALREETDPELLGGAVVRYRDTLFDASLKRRLETLKQRLSQ